MIKINLRHGLLATAIVMALSPTIVLADDSEAPASAQQKKENCCNKPHQHTHKSQEPLQDIPEPDNLNSD